MRVDYLGKQGELTQLLKSIGRLDAKERAPAGQLINKAKSEISKLIDSKNEELEADSLAKKLTEETLDVTLPGRLSEYGSRHPVSRTQARTIALLAAIGFQVVTGPEIEDEQHNFNALNIPEHHPARAMHDTFYCEDGSLLRTHTSPVQIRYMQEHEPPFRMIAPGRVYRRDSDPTHTPMFHQIEGLTVSRTASFVELKNVLEQFVKRFFECDDLKTRLRPSYFPFTEPSAEMDIQCVLCQGEGCRVCSHSGWLEILGCGMVHPNVLRNVNIDPNEYNGYAFGIGLDRLAMLRYKIPDLRLMFTNDEQFLSQF